MEKILDSNTTRRNNALVMDFYTGAHAISIICSLFTIIIYSLNLKQFASIENKINHPLRKLRACMIVQCCTYLTISQLLELVLINFKGSFSSKVLLAYWLQIFSILFSLLFYAWCTAVHVLMFYLTKYLFTAFDVLNQKILFVLSYGIPLAAFVLILSLTQPSEGRASSQLLVNFIKEPLWKWVLFGFRAVFISVMVIINGYVAMAHFQSMKTFIKSTKDILKQLRRRKKLTNSTTIEMNLVLLLIFDGLALFSNIGISSNGVYIYVEIMFHATVVGIHDFCYINIS